MIILIRTYLLKQEYRLLEKEIIDERNVDERNKGVVFKNCAPLTNCKSEINNTEIDNAKDIDIIMPMCNLVEYSDNYSKNSWNLWQYCRDEPNDN